VTRRRVITMVMKVMSNEANADGGGQGITMMTTTSTGGVLDNVWKPICLATLVRA
jgi:hypothetical protein